MLLKISALLFLISTAQAAQIPVTQQELLQSTGLQETFVLNENEKALRELLEYVDEGVSCSIEKLTVEGYTVTKGTATQPTQFEVINTVTGPKDNCLSTDTYTCYTHFFIKNGQWQTLGAECDDSKLDINN